MELSTLITILSIAFVIQLLFRKKLAVAGFYAIVTPIMLVAPHPLMILSWLIAIYIGIRF